MNDRRSQQSQYLRDFILGFADGLTVPFALTAGLSSLGSSRLVIIAGLAELVSGSISMGLGAYLAAVTDRQLYQVELQYKKNQVENTLDNEKEQVYKILCSYGPARYSTEGYVEALCKDKESLVQFMMNFELQVENPKRREAYLSALTMGLAYFLGGILPMIPYFAIRRTLTALFISIGLTACILIVFGFLKAKLFGCTSIQSAQSSIRTLCIGTIAAGASYGIVRAMGAEHAI